jgi:hypothetical protein
MSAPIPISATGRSPRRRRKAPIATCTTPARNCKKRTVVAEPSEAEIPLPPSRPLEVLQQGLREVVTAGHLSKDDAAVVIACLLHAPGQAYVARRVDDALIAHDADGGAALATLLHDLKLATSLREFSACWVEAELTLCSPPSILGIHNPSLVANEQ